MPIVILLFYIDYFCYFYPQNMFQQKTLEVLTGNSGRVQGDFLTSASAQDVPTLFPFLGLEKKQKGSTYRPFFVTVVAFADLVWNVLSAF